MLGLKEHGDIPHTYPFFFFLLMVNVCRDTAHFRCLQKNSNSRCSQQCKKTLFSPPPATVRLCPKLHWWSMFVFMFCFHMRWHVLCLSLRVPVSVVFFSDAELSVLCCHLIPIIRFVLLSISQMKRLVVTMKACNQHEVCQTMPKLTLCVCVCLCVCERGKEITWQNIAGRSSRKGASMGG